VCARRCVRSVVFWRCARRRRGPGSEVSSSINQMPAMTA
jgi:hypothetical protein